MFPGHTVRRARRSVLLFSSYLSSFPQARPGQKTDYRLYFLFIFHAIRFNAAVHVDREGPCDARCPDDIPVYAAELEVLTQLTGFHLTRGMLCAMRRPALPDAAALCANAARVAVLENVMNPTNIGAIFRSAAALGVDAVLLTSAGSDPLYRRAVRVSMGTVFQVPWTYLPADTDWQQTLHTLGFRTAAMALRDDSLRIDDARLRTLPRLAIVLGTEGDGLAGSTIAACDYTVRIPMTHGVDSLNVAAASAVAFYQLALLRG